MLTYKYLDVEEGRRSAAEAPNSPEASYDSGAVTEINILLIRLVKLSPLSMHLKLESKPKRG